MHNALLDVIQYAGDNENIVYHSEIEDFNSKSQLIVNESQEALFYKDGQALDLFTSGRHTLTTDNLPILRKVVGALFGGQTPYPCEVFFVNKVTALDVMWGTDSPIDLEDPKYHLFISVRCNGSMAVHVSDSRRFVVQVAGQMREFGLNDVKRAIRGAVLTVIKHAVSRAINEGGISILEINSHLLDLNATCLELINKEINAFGLELQRFHINTVSAGEEDLAQLKEAKSKAASMVVEAQAMAESRRIQGYDYQTERKFDVLDGAARNEGGAAGTFVGAGVGLGVGLGVGKEVGNMAAGALNQPQPAQSAPNGVTCSNCGQAVPAGAKFCPNCGNKIVIPTKTFCTECGSELAPGTKFCPNCGHKVG